MLPSRHRLRRSTDFSTAVRRGRRASRPLLTVHLLAPDPARPGGPAVALVGLVVGKAVGGSVVRSRTSRRLRHLLRDRVDALPPGAVLVVRAAPAAGSATSAALAQDLDGALAAALRPRAGHSSSGRTPSGRTPSGRTRAGGSPTARPGSAP